jgi:hypothetical protein
MSYYFIVGQGVVGHSHIGPITETIDVDSYIINKELRKLFIDFENRFLLIGMENKELSVDFEKKILMIPKENRTYSIGG